MSGVVINWAFTSESVSMHAYLFTRHINVFIRMLNFRGWSPPRNFPDLQYVKAGEGEFHWPAMPLTYHCVNQ